MSLLNVNMTKSYSNDTFNLPEIVGEIVALTETEFSQSLQVGINDSDFIRNLKLFTQGCIAFANFLRTHIDEESKSTKFILDRTKTNSQIIKNGTALLFQMRQFMTGESLSFVLAGRTPDGMLKEKTYSQDEIFGGEFNNFRVSFAKGQIELASCIEKLSALELQNNSLGQQWSKIEEYGFIKNYRSESDLAAESNVESDEYHVYHKAGPDINVYFNFHTSSKRRTISYYYDLGGGSIDGGIQGMLAYDRGWLYQWLKLYQDVEIDTGSSTPLYPLMSAETSFRENLPGIKSGDAGLQQLKFRNRRVITLRNILNILEGGNGYNGLIPACELFFTSTQNADKKAALRNILLDFTTYNEDEIDYFINTEVDKLMVS